MLAKSSQLRTVLADGRSNESTSGKVSPSQRTKTGPLLAGKRRLPGQDLSESVTREIQRCPVTRSKSSEPL